MDGEAWDGGTVLAFLRFRDFYDDLFLLGSWFSFIPVKTGK